MRGLKTKRKKLHVEQKVKKKTVSFENSFIFLVLDFCTKGFSGFRSLALDKAKLFLLAFLHATGFT